jgi:hypothetical protein
MGSQPFAKLGSADFLPDFVGMEGHTAQNRSAMLDAARTADIGVL